MNISVRLIRAAAIAFAFVIAAGCGGSGTATQFDSQELIDNSAQIQANVNSAGLVFLGTITAVGTAPSFWSGIAESTQPVTYTVLSVLKGTYVDPTITVNHLVVDGTRQADSSPGLNPSIFAVGAQLIVFANENSDYESLSTEFQGPLYMDVDPNYGTIPFSIQNEQKIESMILNPSAQVIAKSGNSPELVKDASFLKTLTVNGSAADVATFNTLLDECKGKSATLSNLVSQIQNSETYTVTLNIVNSEEGVLVDAFTGRKVDVKDLQDWDLDGCNSKTSRCQLFGHFLQEYWHAAVTGDGYAPSHASAIQEENQIRADLGKTTTTTGHWGVNNGGTWYVQTPYGSYTELVQILDGTNVGPVTVEISPPAAPTALAADGSTPCRIVIAWTDNATDEEGYAIERKQGDAGEWSLRETLGADANTWTNAQAVQGDLVQGETFCYRVRAFKIVDGQTVYSDYSNEGCAVKQ